MSIVGTRPPLISETNLYEPHHKVTVNEAVCVCLQQGANSYCCFNL